MHLIPAVDIEYVLSNKTKPLNPLHGKLQKSDG